METDIATLVLQLLAVGPDQESAHLSELSARLDARKLTLLDFVQALGPHLTSDADLIRARSIALLGSTVAQTKSCVSRHDVGVLLPFLISQMADKAVVASALSLLTVIVKLSVFNATTHGPQLLLALKDKYSPLKHLAKVRFEAFELMEALFPKVMATVPTVSVADSASGIDTPQTDSNPVWLQFAQAFEHIANGEKDPRNLIASFELNHQIVDNFPFTQPENGNILADLFDVAFCYFPISFTPPANDPYGITADQLKNKLRGALAAHRLNADDLFSSLIEKLTLTNPAVRNDVLQTMLASVTRFSFEDLQNHWIPLWNALKYEILHNDVSQFDSLNDTIIPKDYIEKMDNTDEFKPLYFTLDILRTLALKLEASESIITQFKKMVFEELKENLCKVSPKLVTQSVLLVSIIASVSVSLYNSVVDFILSYSVWGKYIGIEKDQEVETETEVEIKESPTQNEVEITSGDIDDDFSLSVAQQRLLIDNLGFIIVSYVSSDKNRLLEYKDYLLVFSGMLLRASSALEKTLKSKTVEQLGNMAVLPGFLSSTEWGNVLTWFDEVLNSSIKTNSSWEKDPVVLSIKKTIVRVVEKSWPRSDAVVEKVLPTLLDLLNDKLGDQKSFSKVLDFIGDISVNPRILETLSVRLLRNLELYASSSPELYLTTVSLLVECVNKTQLQLPFIMNGWYKSFVPRFLDLFFKAVDNSKDEESISVVEISGDLISIIIKYVDKDQHQHVLQEFTALFLLEKLVLEKGTVLVNFYIKILSSIHKGTYFKEHHVDELLGKITILLNQQTSPDSKSSTYIKIGYLQLVAILVNKFDQGDLKMIDQILSDGYSKIAGDENDIQEEFAWVLKGLIMRVDQRGLEYLEEVVRLLDASNANRNTLIYQIMNIATIDLPIFTDSGLPKKKVGKLISGVQCYQVRSLYKQRIFAVVFPILLQGYTESGNSLNGKLVYLRALATLLSNVPLSVLKPHLKEFTPMVLSSLQISEISMLESLLKTIEIILVEQSSELVAHLLTLIPRLVSLSLKKNAVVNEQIQLSALRCLILVFLIDEKPKLLKYKSETIHSLVAGLDDRKRSVRKLVTDLRQVLYELR